MNSGFFKNISVQTFSIFKITNYKFVIEDDPHEQLEVEIVPIGLSVSQSSSSASYDTGCPAGVVRIFFCYRFDCPASITHYK